MIRIIISDTANGDHAAAVKAAISAGYGSDISAQIEIRTAGLASDLAYADSIGAIAVVRSTTGYGSYQSLAEQFYPRIQMFMPLGSNVFEELLGSSLSEIVSAGAGDAENKNNTGYGNGLEFWDIDQETSVPEDLSSYSNGIIAGKLLRIKDLLHCTWWKARYRARMSADRTESNRPPETIWHKHNGFGKININAACNFSGEIIPDPNINISTMISQTFHLDLLKDNRAVLSMFRGDSHTLNIYIKNGTEVFNLTGYSAKLTVKKTVDSATELQLYGNEVTITPLEGLISIEISPEDTEGMIPGRHVYDIEITNGVKKYTPVSDDFELKGDVTTEVVPAFITTVNSQILIFVD